MLHTGIDKTEVQYLRLYPDTIRHSLLYRPHTQSPTLTLKTHALMHIHSSSHSYLLTLSFVYTILLREEERRGVGRVRVCVRGWKRWKLNSAVYRVQVTFNAGILVIDLNHWRRNNTSDILEYMLHLNCPPAFDFLCRMWMQTHKDRQLWKNGSQPPLLLTFYKRFKHLDPTWNCDRLGYPFSFVCVCVCLPVLGVCVYSCSWSLCVFLFSESVCTSVKLIGLSYFPPPSISISMSPLLKCHFSACNI